MKTKYPANANPGGRKAPPTMSPAIDVTSWDVMDPGFEARPTKRTVLYPTTAIAMMPRAGTKADAMSVHRRVSGGCRARTMKRYICAFALTPAVQKIVIRSGTNAVEGTRGVGSERAIRYQTADGGRDAHGWRAVPDSIEVSFAPWAAEQAERRGAVAQAVGEARGARAGAGCAVTSRASGASSRYRR